MYQISTLLRKARVAVFTAAFLLLGAWLGQNASAQPCTPTMSNKCCQIGTKNVTFGNSINYTIANYSTSTQYYNEYPNVSACVTAGGAYTLSVETWNGANNQAVCVWIDWDGNDTFAASEIVLENDLVTAGNTASTTVNVPNGQASGDYRMRVMDDWYYYYNQLNYAYNPCQGYYYGDYVDFKITVVGSSGTDLGVSGLIQPTVLTVGNSNTVQFKYKNLAGNTIDSFRAGYIFNGGSPVIENVSTGSNGNALALTTCNEDNYTFNTQFSVGSAGNYTMKVFISHANGSQPDDVTSNDTLTFTACTALSGNYTIDGSKASSGSNYASFTDAVAALNQCGLAGPVTFTVAAGTYNEGVSIGNVTGASNVNTITINGVDDSDRIITNSGAYTIKLDGANFVTIKNLGIENTLNNGAAVAMHVTGDANYNLVDSCHIYVNSSNYQNICYGVSGTNAFTAGKWGSYNTISNTEVKDGYYLFVLNGESNNSKATENKILNCNGSNGRYMGLLSYYQDYPTITGNNILCAVGAGFNYGCYLYYNSNFDFSQNTIASSYYGIMSYYLDGGKVVNNMMYGSQYYSVYAYYASNVNWYHNSFLNDNTGGAYTLYFNQGSNNDFRNNIVQSNGSTAYALYSPATGPFSIMEQNNFYCSQSSNYVYLGSAYSNRAALKGQNGFNNVVYSQAPNFNNITAGSVDLHLTNSVAAIYGDGTTGVTIDRDGDARCTFAPSIGADESKYPVPMPVSNFYLPDTGFVNSPFNCLNSAGPNDGKAFEWYVPAGSANPYTTSRDANVTFSSTGLQCINLKTTNCTGSHDTTKCIYIKNPTTAPDADFIASANVILPYGTVALTDLSTGGPTTWDWIITPGTVGVDYDYSQGTASNSQNPFIDFYTPGDYQICLVASNSIGSDTACKTAYIKVLTVEAMCQNSSSSAATAMFYDDGGPSGNYSSNNTCSFLIDPCASSVTLTFNKFNTYPNYGYLKIYDGASNTGKPFHSGNGFNGNVSIGPFTANSGKIYMEWRSTAIGAPGWEAIWTSTPGNVASPSAAYNTNLTGWVGGNHVFTVANYDPNVSYTWHDCQGNVLGYGSPFTYPFQAAGQYTICLDAANCAGTNTVSKTITVQSPTAAPTADFMANVSGNKSQCNVAASNTVNVQFGDTVQLLDLSNQGANQWAWDVTPSADVVWVDSYTDQNPRVAFVKAGNYTVSLDATNGIGTGSTTKNNFIRVLPPYCSPSISQIINDIGITNVKLGSIDNTSSVNTDGFTDFSRNLSACLDRGAKYPIWVSRGSQLNPVNRKVWVDWNQDGDFTDAGEMVVSHASANTMTWADSLKVPSTATLGATRMRVGVSFGNNANTSCGPNNFGEFEDYGLYITEDVTSPVITLIGNNPLYVEKCTPNWTDPGATAWDAVDGNIVPSMTSSNVNTNTLGTYTVTWEATDVAGNKSSINRTVIVTPDKAGPVITLNGNNPMNIDVNTTYTEPGATATDACDGVMPASYLTTAGTPNTAVIGAYTVTYDATDYNGNAATTVTRTVNVGDFTAPTISLLGNNPLTWPVGTTFVDPGTTVTDNYYTAGLTVSSNAATALNTNVLGTYTITYTCTDPSGNTATATRTVNVTDAVAPVLNLIGNETLTVEAAPSGTWADLGAFANDNYWPNLSVTITGTVDLSVLSTIANPYQTVTYTATDGSGNTTTKTRYVEVKKTTKPMLKLNGSATMDVCRWSTFTDPGVTITDTYYPVAQLNSLLVKTGGPVNTDGEKVWTLGYYVSDPSGNTSDTVWRLVSVEQCFNGLSSVTKNDLRLYPNPTNGVVYLELQAGKYSNGTVTDMNGKVVKTFNVNGDKVQLDLSTLAPATYVCSVIGENGVTRKLVTVTK